MCFILLVECPYTWFVQTDTKVHRLCEGAERKRATPGLMLAVNLSRHLTQLNVCSVKTHILNIWMRDTFSSGCILCILLQGLRIGTDTKLQALQQPPVNQIQEPSTQSSAEDEQDSGSKVTFSLVEFKGQSWVAGFVIYLQTVKSLYY